MTSTRDDVKLSMQSFPESSLPPRAQRQAAESLRGLERRPGKRKQAIARQMRQRRLHRYQWALRRLLAEARLERMKMQAVGK